jgi:hypothetical protein
MFPLLPKLSPNHSVPPPTPGSWRDSTADELQNVADGLDSAAVDVEVSSIPDVWARPMLFEAALFDWRHILHRQVVGEWRGLLATIALAEVRAFPVTVETCSLLGRPEATSLQCCRRELDGVLHFQVRRRSGWHDVAIDHRLHPLSTPRPVSANAGLGEGQFISRSLSIPKPG